MNQKLYVETLASFGGRTALNHGHHSYTYAQLTAEITRQGERLAAAGVRAGQTVFLQGDYSLEAIALLFAIYLNNGIVALNSVDNPRERDSKLTGCGAQFLLDLAGGTLEPVTARGDTALPLVEELIGKGRAGLILFSSGSTGKPKAMLHDLDTLVASYDGRRPRSINMLVFLLFDHIGGINTLLSVLAAGGTATIPVERTPEHIAQLIQAHRVAVLPTSPSFLNLMLVSGVFDRYDFSALRLITYGTEPMPESLLKRLHARLPRIKLLQTFGTSETGIVSTSSQSSDSLLLKFDDPAIRYKVVEGELWLHSDRRILGYLNHPSDSFTSDGWFRTGDLVEEVQGGYLRVKGRLKEVINVGGQKVVPSEVESVLLQHPGVRDCKVFGESNNLLGQIVAAQVVLDPDLESSQRAGAVQDIRRFARTNMDPYKVPARLTVVEQLAYSARFKKALPSLGTAGPEESVP